MEGRYILVNVIKRDGRKKSFNKDKIRQATLKAFEEVDGEITSEAKAKASEISTYIENTIDDNTNVENIQDIIEEKLMASKRKDVAKAFIIYRNNRSIIRESQSDFMKKVYGKVNATDIENSNANVNEHSFSGREKEASAILSKHMALELGGLSKEVAEAHKNMLVYQHDLDKAVFGFHNCLNLNFQELFTYGFSTRNGDVRPPSSFSTACQLVAVAFQCQSQTQFGGVGTIHLDYDLAPFVKKSWYKYVYDGFKYIAKLKVPTWEDMSISEKEQWHVYDNRLKEVYPDVYEYAVDMLEKEGTQSAQGLFHNLNTLESRQGSQLPFTSINLGRDTSIEGRLVTKWILGASIDGIGKHHLTSIFPISIFQYKTGTNADKEDINYDMKQLALKSMAKRIYPNWANGDWSQAHEDENNPDTFFSTMGCRTLVGYDRHGLGYIRQGRGNNVPNTIILPKLGIEYGICLGKRAKADIDGFWVAFESALMLCEKGLLERYNIIKRQSPEAAPFMYSNNTIQDARNCKDSVENAVKHNTLAIGYIGIAEMCQALFGKNHAQDSEVCDFAVSVVRRINKFASEASERNNLNFSCYATPAEGLCSTSLKALRKQYGIIENVTSHNYLTNSHHVPVWEKISIYDKLRIESRFTKYPTGGCITYVELDSTFVENTKAVEDIIDFAFKECDIPYLAFNFPIDSCLNCGYQGEMNDKCPQCKSGHIQHLARVTGYLSTDVSNFNDGKKAEVSERVKHSTYTNFGDENNRIL